MPDVTYIDCVFKNVFNQFHDIFEITPKNSKPGTKRRNLTLARPKTTLSSSGTPAMQQHLDIYDMTDTAEVTDTILPGDAYRMLNAMEAKKSLKQARIFFHNDADGLGGACIGKRILKKMGFDIQAEDVIPVTHLELGRFDDDSGHYMTNPAFAPRADELHLYIDIQPPLVAENVFCIDHHPRKGRNKEFGKNILIYAPENIEKEFPTTAALVVFYLRYIQERGQRDYKSFVIEGLWVDDQLSKWLGMFAAVSDNLWMLSPVSSIPVLTNWITRYGMSEEDLIRFSMGISLMLGQEEGRMNHLYGILQKTPSHLSREYFEHLIEPISRQVDNLFHFAESISYESRVMVAEMNARLAEELRITDEQINRDQSTLAGYLKALPAGMKVDKQDREALKHLSQTIGRKDSKKWQQIGFYAVEIERLSTRIERNEKKLEMLSEKAEAILPDNVPGICLFIMKQSSEQVKGITSSLLYYFGNRNIVVEENEHFAVWGARGFDREQLENELTTLVFDKQLLRSYLNMETISGDMPKAFRRSMNISQNIEFVERYVGGIGGRGKIFGGNIKGKVPLLFATLDAKDIQEKLQELVAHGELGKALKGLTEGDSQVPTAQALRSKFKTRGWVTFQATGGDSVNDILTGDPGILLVWLAGDSKEVRINPPPARLAFNLP